MKELKFALQCQGDTKPVQKKNKNPGDQSLASSVPYLAFDGVNNKEPAKP